MVVGCLAHHQLGVVAHGLDALDAVDRLDRDDRGFVEHDAAPAHINDRVGRAQIDRHVLRGEFEHFAEKRHATSCNLGSAYPALRQGQVKKYPATARGMRPLGLVRPICQYAACPNIS
jgi:hypothetical protein